MFPHWHALLGKLSLRGRFRSSVEPTSRPRCKSFIKFVGAEKDWGLQLFENQMVRSLVDSCALVPYGIPEVQCMLKGKATIAAISLESAPGGSVSKKVDTLQFADGSKLTELREKHNLACISVTAGDIIALPAGSLVMTAIEDPSAGTKQEDQSGEKKRREPTGRRKRIGCHSLGCFFD